MISNLSCILPVLCRLSLYLNFISVLKRITASQASPFYSYTLIIGLSLLYYGGIALRVIVYDLKISLSLLFKIAKLNS